MLKEKSLGVFIFLILVIPQILTSQENTSVLTQSDNTRISDDSLAVVLEDAWKAYNEHEYITMSSLLEAHVDDLYDRDTIELQMYYALTMAYGHLDWHEKMIECIVDGLLLARKLDDHFMLLSFYRELGSFHDHPLDDQEAGLEYMKMAIPYMDAVKPSSQCGLMMDIGLTSVNAGQLDSAQYYFDQAFEYLAQDSGMTPDLYAFYAPFLLKARRLDEAQFYLDFTYDAWKEIGFTQGYTSACLGLAELNFYREEYGVTIDFAREAEELAVSLSNPFYEAEAIEWKAKAQEALGMTEAGLRSYKALNQKNQEIDEIKKEQKLEQKQLAFLTSQYTEKLTQVTATNRKLYDRVAASFGMLLFCLIVFILVLYLYYGKYREKKEQVEVLTSEITMSEEEWRLLQAEHKSTVAELEINKRTLTSTALFMEKKDEALRSVRKMLTQIESKSNQAISEKLSSVRKIADNSLSMDNNWDSFKYFFLQVYPSFYVDIKSAFDNLNQNELRSLSYIKMGLTDKECARLLGINTASFQKSKYRLKKKLLLPKEQSLEQLVSLY